MTTTTTSFAGRFLVQGHSQQSIPHRADTNVDACSYPLLITDVSLSFWGGLHPETGDVIDWSHPLVGANVANTIFCLPSGRGSCTASQVLLELILQHRAPRAIVLRDDDVMVSVGALIAQEVFQRNVPDIIYLGSEAFQQLLQRNPKYGRIQRDGTLLCQDDDHTMAQHGAESTTATANEESHPLDLLDSITLTEEEQHMLSSAQNEAQRMATRVLIRYAHMTKLSPSYRTVTKAHIDGCTYIGPGGLEFVKRLVQSGGSVAVPTTLNAVSADRRQWSALGVPEPYAKASLELGDAYLALNCQPSFTCAPYLLPHATPHAGEDVVWGESNAVVFANSVLGARTEKYADYLDICCAIVGKVAATGVHLDEHRRPKRLLDATELALQLCQPYANQSELSSSSSLVDLELLFPALGHLCGTASDGQVPLLIGFQSWHKVITRDHLKAFCAAFGTTGTSPLVHIAGITPEAQEPQRVEELVNGCEGPPKVLSLAMLEETFWTLDSGRLHNNDDDDDKVNLVALGNPHLSVSECQKLAELVTAANNTKHPKVRIMACMSRLLHAQAHELGHVESLTKFGVEFIHDTCWCMLLDPPVIPTNKAAKILTNSGKYAHYGPGLTQRQFRFGSMEDCVRAAISGSYPRKETLPSTVFPTWLTRQAQQQRTYATWSKRSTLAASMHPNLSTRFTSGGTMVRGILFFVKRLK